MSASVFKPIHPHHGLPTRQRPPVFAEKRLCRVRRALFEPIDREETQRFLKRELELHARNEMSKWEFDFVKGAPLNPTAASRYMWQPLRPTALQAPLKTRPESAVEVDNSDLYHRPTTPSPLRESVVVVAAPVVEAPAKRQSKITDYMQSRKRSAADLSFSKKLTSSPKPPKISRDCS